jgi:hypothetical protein
MSTTTGVAICIIKVKVLQRLVILLPPLSLFRFDATVTQYKKNGRRDSLDHLLGKINIITMKKRKTLSFSCVT